MYRVLIVEDDEGIAAGVERLCRSWGFSTLRTVHFRQVMDDFTAFDPHLVLMDVALPCFNGFYWCAEIRKVSKVPVIFLSSASDNMNIVMAMNMGGDDFIAKPFDGGVLMAKVQAMLRRAYDFAPPAPVLEHRGAAFRPDSGELTVAGHPLRLTRNEQRILLCLMENKGRIVSRETLMERLWETDSFVDENTLTVNVNRLRKKLDGAGLPGFIETRFGQGYTLCSEENDP